jgi:hypothetical protein
MMLKKLGGFFLNCSYTVKMKSLTSLLHLNLFNYYMFIISLVGHHEEKDKFFNDNKPQGKVFIFDC